MTTHKITALRAALLTLIFSLFLIISVPVPASALSCLPVADYLKSVVADENTVVFSGTVKDQIEGKDYTAEVVTVGEVLKGYVEAETFVYHRKDATWGYLCNAGPKNEGSTGVYIAERDQTGTYYVSQRLETNDTLLKTLKDDLKEANATGERVEFSKTDRINQLFSTITDLFGQINRLFKELAYWRAS